MAQNTTLTIAASTWTLITDSDVSAITFQNLSGVNMLVKATTDTTQPTTALGALTYLPKQGEANILLSDLFPGLSARDRIWVWAASPIEVLVSHA